MIRPRCELRFPMLPWADMRCFPIVLVVVTACTVDVSDPGGPSGDPLGDPTRGLPPVDAAFDYQLGGGYPPPSGVQIVTRDREDVPAPGLYNICYINGFQVQLHEEEQFVAQHPELILRDANDQPIRDPQWKEIVIDISTQAQRETTAAIVTGWIDGCHQAGFQAIEIDNLDSFTRSAGRFTEDDAVAAMALMADAAHVRGLPISQKNSSEQAVRKAELKTDFAVAEECNRFDECQVYRDAYGDHVLVIEYRSQDFTAGCAAFPALSIVLRDVDLVTPGTAGYVYDGC